MKKFVIAAVAAALLPLSVSVQAKTVCMSLFGGDGQMKMTVKPLKKPGTYSPIVGVYREGNNVAAMQGSAMVNADGTISLGFQVQNMTPGGYPLAWDAVGLDTSFQGTYNYDNNMDGISNGSSAFTVISCKDFSIVPPG